MANQIITVATSNATNMQANSIKVGAYTTKLLAGQTKLAPSAKTNILNEATEILSHCKLPGDTGFVTNLAMGYVQSGKTLSFTTLSTLAMDNGIKIIVYFAGSKNNLVEQTIARLKKDLDLNNTREIQLQANIPVQKTSANQTIVPQVYIDKVSNLLDAGYCLLFPILKHKKYIGQLAELFSMTTLQSKLANMPVLIIDDEADQSSLNTKAFQNATNGTNDASATYENILALRKACPIHSYVQYTATPQAAFLIDTHDCMSPEYFTVLTPGSDYTGGDYFFNSNRNYIVRIPVGDCYHHKNNVLPACPDSLKHALLQFYISVAQVVKIEKRENFLSMMVHIDGVNITNTQFANWISTLTNQWKSLLDNPNDPAYRVFVNNTITPAYNEITKYQQNASGIQSITKELKNIMLLANIQTVQQGDEDTIDWNSSDAHVLVGAEKLNRGFTIENLSMTYMPRSPKGKSNADTIEQRCRFFGYKQNYSDVIRLYLSEKGETELREYCKHEEILRDSLLACSSRTVQEFRQKSNGQNLLISRTLNPTRKNILSKKLVQSNMKGWAQMRSKDCYQQNMNQAVNFLSRYTGRWVDIDYGTDATKHRHTLVDINDFISFFEQMQYLDLQNNTRKALSIRYLEYLRDKKGVGLVDIYEMAYAMPNGRTRSLDSNGDIQNLHQGCSASGRYPGDAKICDTNYISIQFHHLTIKDNSVQWGNKQMYNLAIYYPDQYATSFTGL